MMRLALILPFLLAQEDIQPRYAANKSARDRVYVETKLGIRIEGTDQLANLVRSMHPFLSMEKLQIRAEGGFQVVSQNRRKVEYEEARVDVRYEDRKSTRLNSSHMS